MPRITEKEQRTRKRQKQARRSSERPLQQIKEERRRNRRRMRIERAQKSGVQATNFRERLKTSLLPPIKPEVLPFLFLNSLLNLQASRFLLQMLQR